MKAKKPSSARGPHVRIVITSLSELVALHNALCGGAVDPADPAAVQAMVTKLKTSAEALQAALAANSTP